MKNELTNNSIATKKLNSSKNYNKDKNTYFIYYIAGVIVLGVFLNLAVNIKSTDEYYEKYISNYEEEDSDSDGYEEIDDDEDTGSSEEIDESLNEEDNSDTDINEEY